MDKRSVLQGCLEHYLRSEGVSLEELSKFCVVSKRAAENWGQSFPKGLTLVKAISFVSLNSDQPVRQIINDDLVYKAMLVLALDMITPSEMASRLGYSEEYDSYRFILGTRILNEQKKFELKNLIHPFSNDLKIIMKKNEPSNSTDIEGFVQNFSSLFELLLKIEPSLDSLISSNPDNRTAFRDLLEKNNLSMFTTSNAIYRIAEKFNALCSEKSLKTKMNS